MNMVSQKYLLDAIDIQPQALQGMLHDAHVQAQLQIRPADVQRTGVQCPVTEAEVIVPCTLKGCVYYTEATRCHHCALVYAQNRDSLCVEDLALLYRKPVREMEVTVESVLHKIRGLLDGPAPRFVPLDGVCCACEAPVEDTPTITHGLTYCTPTCADAFPPSKVRAGYIPAVGDRHERD